MMLRLHQYFLLFILFVLQKQLAAQTVHDIAVKVRGDIRKAENDSIRIRKINLNIKEITIRNKDTALAFLQLEERITERACAKNEKQCRFLQSECEYGKGLYFHYHDQYLLAVEHYLKSAAIKQEIQDVRGLAQLYNMIGIVYRLVGDQHHALDFQNKSLIILDSIGDKKSASRAYNNIGNIYTDLHEFDKAVSMHQKSFELKKTEKDTTGMANSLNNISDCMREMGRFEKALQYDDEALRIRIPTGDSIGIAFSLQSKGLTLTAMKRYDEALQIFNQAIAILINQGEHHALSEDYTYAGKVLLKMSKCDLAIEYFNKALNAAVKTNAIDKRKDALLGLSDAYSCQGKTDLAFGYYKQYIAARDSIQNAEKSKQNARAEFQLQFDDMKRKMDAEKISLRKEAEKRQLIIYLIAAGALITFSFLIFAVRSNRIKNKLNDELQQKKLTIEDKNKSIVDSITYAQRIQRALLASDKLLRKNLNNFFILYQPKDIVSGDFY
ncbi:MAG: hypothetical protein Fur0041_16290 [Bacteroidia bacterium]